MAVVLDRLRRLRALLEDAARADLERQAAFVVQVERAQRREEEASRRLRAESLARLRDGRRTPGLPERIETAGESEQRFLAGEEQKAGLSRRQRLRLLAEREAERMLSRREEFLLRRKERQQVEILLQAEAHQRRVEEARREQRDLDDWFAAARARRQRDARP